jgi:hypothetical protein
VSTDVTTFAGRIAREIDRLVVGAHGRAADWPAIAALRDEPEWLPGAAPMLTSFGAVLLVRPVRGADVSAVLRYFKPERGVELWETSVALGIVDPDGALTVRGRELAEATVAAQEDCVADGWEREAAALGTADRILGELLPRVEALAFPAEPSTFSLFRERRPARPPPGACSVP